MEGPGPMGPAPMAPPGPPGPPSQAEAPPAPPAGPEKSTEELIESIVNERLTDVTTKLESLDTSRVDTKEDLQEIKETLTEIKGKYISLQEDSSIRLEEYSKELENVGAQIKAMQKVLQKVFPAIAENVHQLTQIVQDMKGVKQEEE